MMKTSAAAMLANGSQLKRAEQADAVRKPARDDRTRRQSERIVSQRENGEGGAVQRSRSQPGNDRARRSSRSGGKEHADAKQNELRAAQDRG